MNYVKIYKEYFGYGIDDFIPCERCGKRYHSIHHIINKKMGGNKTLDYIENLMAVCKKCHDKFTYRILSEEDAMKIHLGFMKFKTWR